MNFIRKNLYFLYTFVTLLLFWAFSNVLPLFWEDGLHIFTTKNSNLTKIEELVTYSPWIQNSTISNFFSTDYTSILEADLLPPFPFVVIIIFKFADFLSNDNIDLAISLLHSLLIVQFFSIRFALKWLLDDIKIEEKGLFINSIALFAVFALALKFTLPVGRMFDTFFAQGNLMAILLSMKGVFRVPAYVFILGFITTALNFYVFKKHSLLIKFTFSLLTFSIFLFGLVLNLPIFFENQIQRVPSPVISLIFLFYTLGYSFKIDSSIKKGVLNWQTILFFPVLVSSNFYVHFHNVPLVIIICTLLVIFNYSYFKKNTSKLILSTITFLILVAPYFYSTLISKSGALRDYVERARYIGTEPLSVVNFHHWGDIISHFGLLLILTFLFFFYVVKVLPKKLSYKFFTPFILCWLLFFLQTLNNFFNTELMPQSVLLFRYTPAIVIFTITTIYFSFSHKLNSKTKQKVCNKHIMFVQALLFSTSFSLITLGVGSIPWLIDSNKAFEEYSQKIDWLELQLPKDSIIFSRDLHLDLLAPGFLGVKTLYPNPIITAASNKDLVNLYSIHCFLVSCSWENYTLNYVRDFELHGQPLLDDRDIRALGGSVSSMNGGHLFPLPSSWINKNQKYISDNYEHPNFDVLFNFLRKHKRSLYEFNPSETSISRRIGTLFATNNSYELWKIDFRSLESSLKQLNVSIYNLSQLHR